MTEQDSLRSQISARINSASLQLPVFNRVVLELQRRMNDPDVGTRQLEAVIAKDPALVAQVLRLANSSRYAGLNKIATVDQALLRLGTQQVCRLALAASQLSLYKTKYLPLESYMADSWNRAYASAIGAGWIAERTGHAGMAQAAFLAGLLHDVGNLLILMVLEDIEMKAGTNRQFSASLINDILNSLHCECGYMLMQRWNLPEIYCNAARDHHLQALDARDDLIMVVRLMDMVCLRMGIGCTADPALLPAASPEAENLGISEITLAELEVFLEESLGLTPT